MSYLEELLPEFRKGAKIRQKSWEKGAYIEKSYGITLYHNIQVHKLSILDSDWEFYQEPIDYDYIIKNKCLCWFWDGSGDYKNLGILIKVYENNTLCRYDCRKSNGDFSQYANCRPVRRDEVTFYEDRKDE